MTEDLILDILKNAKHDLMILEIAERAGINRITASKYLAVLEAKGYIKHRAVGKAKLFSLVNKK